MFDLFNKISSTLSGPILEIAYSLEGLPLLFAFFLGVVGAVAPCQLTSNVSAITIYGNKSLSEKVPWLHVFLFIMGKIAVFSILGIVIWLLGREIYSVLAQILPLLRKAVGPLLIFIGLFMLGLFRWLKENRVFTNKGKANTRISKRKTWRIINFSTEALRDTYLGSFLMGVSFTVPFCPTMFVLFLFTLMPVVLTTSYGVLLPSVFGIGTSLPLLLVIFLIWYFGASGTILRRGRQIGTYVQKIAGVLILLIGVFDTLIYWL